MTLRLAAGGYQATVDERGAALAALTHHGRPLVFATDDPLPTPRYRGAVLVPWPNRIADGRYTFDGVEHQLPVNEVGRSTALHGLALHHDWTVVEEHPSSTRLRTTVRPQPGYPFELVVAAAYDLRAESGLTLTVTAENAGPVDAPYGASIHPYLCADGGTVDEWIFTTAASCVLEVDAQRLLPVRTVPVDGTDFDFRVPRPIGARRVDHALTALDFDAEGHAEATLVAADGGGTRMRWDTTCRWLQVHTTDLPGEPAHRRGLAVEPMTCAPDAFNSGAGLVRLRPGQRHVTSWTIAALVPEPRRDTRWYR